jgi:putative protein kinase ArgK-like GTPase of G3E family
MDGLSDAVSICRTDLHRHAKALGDRMADIPSEYQQRDALDGLVGDVLGHLASAGNGLDELVEHSMDFVEQRVKEQVAAERKRSKNRDKA